MVARFRWVKWGGRIRGKVKMEGSERIIGENY